MSGEERKDHSMLISLDSLTAANPNQGDASGAAGDGESGLIDLGGIGLGAPGEESPGLMAPGFEAAAPIRVAPVRSYNLGAVLGIAVGVLLLVGGGVYFGTQMSKSDPAPQPGAGTPSLAAGAAATTGSTAPSAAAAAPSAPPSAVASAPASDGADGGTTVASAPAAPESAPATEAKKVYTPAQIAAWKAKQARLKAEAEEKAKAEAAKVAAAPAKPKGPTAPAAPKGKDEVDDMLTGLNGGGAAAAARTGGGTVVAPDDPLLPKKLGKAQILGVVRKNAAGVAKCKAETKGESGTVMVDMVIAKTGTVTQANVVTGQKGTQLGNCVERKVKVFRFPQFNGPPMRIKMPFAM